LVMIWLFPAKPVWAFTAILDHYLSSDVFQKSETKHPSFSRKHSERRAAVSARHHG
jgi:hypothetical protein